MTLNLAEIETPRQSVILPSGREVPVRALNGKTFDLYNQLQNNAADASLLWEIGKELLSEATDEEVKALTVRQLAVVLAIAAGQPVDAGLALVQTNGETTEPPKQKHRGHRGPPMRRFVPEK